MDWKSHNQAVDVTHWDADEEYSGPYPEGAREKSLLFCPSTPPAPFLVADHHYLFKHSVRHAPEQYWCEIVAYRIGTLLGVEVPPAHAAYDTESNQGGALIEWFYGHPGRARHDFTRGGDHLVSMIPNFDREKGTQHNSFLP